MSLPHSIARTALFLAILLFGFDSANAGSVYGVVTEIEDGDTMTIIVLKRPLKIRLMGIDAPDKNQAYADVARQHLSDLILDKFVGVEYSGLGANGLIIGKVFLKDMDVGAQMIRDGVAWFDKNYDTSLSESQRQVYAASEIAARNEQRGLWQERNPIPPWEFKEAQRRGQIAKSTPAQRTPTAVKRATPRSGLTSEGLLQTFGGPSELSLAGVAAEPISNKSGSRWTRWNPPGGRFSIVVPGDGTQRLAKVPLADGRVALFHVYMGRYDKTAYFVISSGTPNGSESEISLLDSAIKAFITGIQRDWEKLGSTFLCEPSLDREFSISGYEGRQYDLSGCTVPGKVRLYTRVIGDIRELNLTATFFFGSLADPNASQFFDSFLAKPVKGAPGN